MVFLILESLGSTELLFILVMALVFFGPRKLPQLSRSLGKTMAEFRRHSDDFKRTWEREASLEEFTPDLSANPATFANENSILNQESISRTLQSPTIEPIAADHVMPRQPFEVDASQSPNSSDFGADEAETPRKRDWL